MKRLQSPIIACTCLVAVLAALGACSGKKTTVTTSNGNVTVEQGSNGQTTTVKGAEGEMKFGKGAVDPASLGLPVYPGSTQSENSVSLNASTKNGSGQMVTLSTDDPFDKVYDYYKGQMPTGSEKAKVSSGGMQMATFQIGDSSAKDAKSVVIQESGGKVTIQLVHATKD